MSGQKTGQSVDAGRPVAWRLLLVGIMLLTFAVQGFVVQTHIHAQSAVQTLSQKADTGSTRHDNYPANEDPASCPLCKELLYSGQYVAPMWAVIYLPTVAVSLIETATRPAQEFAAPSQGWSSRAPPRN